MLLAIAAAAMVISACLCAWVPSARILHVTAPNAAAETAPALLVFAVGSALNMPLGVVQRVQQGLQEGYITNLWLALGNLVSLGLLLCFIRMGLGLPWLVAAVIGGPVLASLMNSVVEFGWRRPWLAPKLSLVRRTAAREILLTGVMIFSSQAGAAVLLSCPMFLLAHAAGALAVAPFSILQRVYSVFIIASSLLMTPPMAGLQRSLCPGRFRLTVCATILPKPASECADRQRTRVSTLPAWLPGLPRR